MKTTINHCAGRVTQGRQQAKMEGLVIGENNLNDLRRVVEQSRETASKGGDRPKTQNCSQTTPDRSVFFGRK